MLELNSGESRRRNLINSMLALVPSPKWDIRVEMMLGKKYDPEGDKFIITFSNAEDGTKVQLDLDEWRGLMFRSELLIKFIFKACFEEDSTPEDMFRNVQPEDCGNGWKKATLFPLTSKVVLTLKWNNILRDCQILLHGDGETDPFLISPDEFVYFIGFWVGPIGNVLEKHSKHSYSGDKDDEGSVLIAETKEIDLV